MTLHEDLFTYVSTKATITAIIGSGDDCRFYPLKADDGVAAPYCVYFKISAPVRYTQDGASSLQQSRWQISVFAGTYVAANTLAGVIVAALEAWHASDVNNPSALQENEQDFYEPATLLYHIPLDFSLWHSA